MSVFDDIKAKADANGDGTINMDDLNDFKDQLSPDQFAQLKEQLLGNDGQLSLGDLQNINLGNFGDTFNSIKDSLGGFFK